MSKSSKANEFKHGRGSREHNTNHEGKPNPLALQPDVPRESYNALAKLWESDMERMKVIFKLLGFKDKGEEGDYESQYDVYRRGGLSNL